MESRQGELFWGQNRKHGEIPGGQNACKDKLGQDVQVGEIGTEYIDRYIAKATHA